MKEYKNIAKTIRLPNRRLLDNFKSNLIGDSYGSISEGRCVEVALEASNMVLQEGSVDSETVLKIARGDLVKLESTY